MSSPDSLGPMQGPRSTDDVMKAAVTKPCAAGRHGIPDQPATEAATRSVKTDQADA